MWFYFANILIMYNDVYTGVSSLFVPYLDIIPRLVMALVILVIGIIFAWIIYHIVRWIIIRTGLQRFMMRYMPVKTTAAVGGDIATVIAKGFGYWVFLIVLHRAVQYL